MDGDNWILYDDGKLTTHEFYKKLVEEFPSLNTEIESWGNIGEHPMMEVFSSYTIDQYQNKNFPELRRCFEFVEDHLGNVKDEIINALKVSYCETIISEVRNPDIQNYMGINFKTFYLEYEEYWNNLNLR